MKHYLVKCILFLGVFLFPTATGYVQKHLSHGIEQYLGSLMPFKAPVERLQENYVRKSTLVAKDSLNVSEEDLECLTITTYKESKGEGERGMILVAQSILNRVGNDGFPNTICEVVKQKLAGKCMFSSWCTKEATKITEWTIYRKVEPIAKKALVGEYESITKATYFKRCDKKSKFFNKLKYLGREKSHCFFIEYEDV